MSQEQFNKNEKKFPRFQPNRDDNSKKGTQIQYLLDLGNFICDSNWVSAFTARFPKKHSQLAWVILKTC